MQSVTNARRRAPTTAQFRCNDAYLEQAAEVVFQVGSEGCSPDTRSIDLVSQNRAIKRDASGVFTGSSLANFSSPATQLRTLSE